MSHRTTAISLLLLAGLAAAGASSAKTVYVPLVADRTVDGARLEAEVRFTNDTTGKVRRARHLLVPSFADGSGYGADDGRVVAVDPGASVIVDDAAPPGESGFLRVTSGEKVAVESRLVGTSATGVRTVGDFAPAIEEDDVFAPGAVTVLEGWRRAPGEVRTDFHVLNLAGQPATCTVDLARADGTPVIDGYVLPVPAFAHLPIPDALGAAGVERAGNWVSAVSCDREFYPYLTRQDLVTGELRLIAPTPPVEVPPGEPEEPESGDCPTTVEGGAFVLRCAGTFHSPTKAKEMHVVQIPFAKGTTFSKIVVTMRFTHGGWRPNDAGLLSGNHGIFWLQRHPKWGDNVFGYLNAFGPESDAVKLSSNVGAAKGQMFKDTTPAELVPGETYRVHFEYDTAKGTYWAEIHTAGGQPVGRRMQLAAKVGQIVVKDAGGFFIAFGHTRHAVGPEVPTYGWKYGDLEVRFVE